MKKFAIIFCVLLSACSSPQPAKAEPLEVKESVKLEVGADRLDQYLPLLEGKRVALVVNHTAQLSTGEHLLDILLAKKTKVVKIFAPEHGFRGEAADGAMIVDGKDKETGLPVVSLYGKNYKPTNQQLSDVDVVIFDIQDVGTRFFTYISTMHYVMDACSQNNKQMIILDRPNPNDFIDGPILDLKYKSFIGMHAIPVLHGLTIGELAQMINGEGWLPYARKADITIIPMTGWTHGQPYLLPVLPSPNLPNNQAIKLYPSLCFFEGTNVSIGRGTKFPFQIIGGTNPNYGTFTFTPKPMAGSDKPPLNGQECYGINLTNFNFKGGLSLVFLLDFYNRSELKGAFFKNAAHMDLLSGNSNLRNDIVKGKSEEQIREGWVKGLQEYKVMRAKYLLYDDYKKQNDRQENRKKDAAL